MFLQFIGRTVVDGFDGGIHNLPAYGDVLRMGMKSAQECDK